jgi:N-acetyltransferase 10
LIKHLKGLKQLYTLAMDVHKRYRTEAYGEIEPRFNERFILSLSECKSCIFMDDELNILPTSSHINQIEPL